MKSKTARRVAMTITVLRLPIVALFFLWVYTTHPPEGFFTALVLLALVEITDMLDGGVARRFGGTSELGAAMDPWSDSISRLTVYSALACVGLTSFALPIVMAMRDITVSYTRIITVSHGGSAGAYLGGKVKAWVQGVGAFALLSSPALDWSNGVQSAISWTVGVVTVLSMTEYIAGVFRVLREQKQG